MEIKFVKAQKKASSDGGPINMGGPLNVQAAPKANMGPPPGTTPGSEKSMSFKKSILGPRPKHIIVNNVRVPIASDNEVKQFYKPLSKPGVGFSKPNFRSKTPPPRRVINNYHRPKTPQPKRNTGRQNQPRGFPICLGVDLEPDEWIKDSGCSKHMTGNRKLFSSYKAYNGGNVIFGSNLRGNIIGKGHVNMRLIQSLASKELVRNLPKFKFDQHFCDACKIRKQAHASHKAKNIVSTTRCLELLHMNLFSPSAIQSYGGNRYTLVIVDDYSRLMEKLEALTIKINSQFSNLKEELQDIRNKYDDLRDNHVSKNHLNDDTPMYERQEANSIHFEELNNDVRNDLEDFKRRVHSMRTVHWKLYDKNNRKTTGVLPNKESKTVNQEPQSKTDLEKSITKFLDSQRVTSMFFKNNVNDMILKMKQNEKNFQTIFKNMERKIDEWSQSQTVSSEHTDRTDPPPPQAHTEHVNAVFTGSGKSDDSLKIQKDPPPPIIVDNKIEKDRPIKTSKKGYHIVKTKDYPFSEYIPKIPYPQAFRVDHSHLNCIIKES
ncbi:hypothetical protein Tco_0803375 [Tanacetum coccineum]|uniref:Retrovirus-related Pol polyprotein from transposon TNT 1-94-like beta-barrel domain-containing protein n=1 Tax=Tanacetum coccineum TaxID=301880 RepID=A0ABQ5A2C7_9ASTR